MHYIGTTTFDFALWPSKAFMKVNENKDDRSMGVYKSTYM